MAVVTAAIDAVVDHSAVSIARSRSNAEKTLAGWHLLRSIGNLGNLDPLPR